MLDCTYRVQIPHRSDQLARVMGVIAEDDGLIGDIITVSVGREHSIREMTVEVGDNDLWQRAVLGLAVVGSGRRFAESALDEVVRFVRDEAEVTDVEREIQTFGDALENNDLGFSTR